MKAFVASFLFVLLLVGCKKNPVEGHPPSEALVQLNVSYGSDTAQRMDIYLPPGRSSDSTKVMVLIHGGAWTTGDKSEFTQYVSILQQKLPGYAVFNINYRLATVSTNLFPTQENDVKAAVNFIVSKAGNYNVNANKLVLLGASAGAHLALLQAYKNPSPAIKAVVDMFGPTDMVALYNVSTGLYQTGLQLLLGGTPATKPSAYQESSPINYVSAQSPPTIIFHGEKDPIVPISQSANLKAKLQSFGVVHSYVTYPNEGHAWYGAALDDTFIKIAAFLLTNVK